MAKLTRREFVKTAAVAAVSAKVGMAGPLDSSPLTKPTSEKQLMALSLEQVPPDMRLVVDDQGNFIYDAKGMLFAYERYLTKAPGWVQDRIKAAEAGDCRVLSATATSLIVTSCMNDHVMAARTGNTAQYTMRASTSRLKYEKLLEVYERVGRGGFVRPQDMRGVDAGVADPQTFFAGDVSDPSWIKTVPRQNGTGFHLYDRDSLSIVSFAPLGVGAYWNYYTAEKARDVVAAHGVTAEIQGSVSLDGKAKGPERKVIGGVWYMQTSPLTADERDTVSAQSTFYLESTGKTDSRYLKTTQLDAIRDYMVKNEGGVNHDKFMERAFTAASVNKYNHGLWAAVKSYVDAGLLVRGKDTAPAAAERSLETGLSREDAGILNLQCTAYLSGDPLESRFASSEQLKVYAAAATVNGKLSVPHLTSLVLGDAARLDDLQDMIKMGRLKKAE